MGKLIIKNRYATISNELLNNENISLKAKGLFAFLQSKPDNWNFSKERIAKQLKEGVSSLKTAYKELKKEGYLTTIAIKNKEGKFNGHDYFLTDNPKGGITTSTKTHPVGNHTSFSKKENSKKENSNNKLSKESKPEVYGRQDITEIIEYLKEKNNNMIDGTVALNRRYAKHLLDKVKKAYPEANTLLQVKAIIKTAKDDDFHSRNATSMKYLYYNTQKIIEIIKGGAERVAVIN